jgi:putative ABC transport system substrate-binding protein
MESRLLAESNLLLPIFLPITASIAEAQQAKKVPVIGVLRSESPSSHASEHDVFREALRERNYVEGKNIVVEYRYAEGKQDRFPELAVELVRQKVDVIIVAGGGAVSAAKRATSTIPIVVASAGDLVGDEVVASLAETSRDRLMLTRISARSG